MAKTYKLILAGGNTLTIKEGPTTTAKIENGVLILKTRAGELRAAKWEEVNHAAA